MQKKHIAFLFFFCCLIVLPILIKAQTAFYDPTNRPDNITEGYQEQTSLSQLKIGMVFIHGTSSYVTIDGKIYRQGDMVRRFKLLRITRKRLEFSSGKETHYLDLVPKLSSLQKE